MRRYNEVCFTLLKRYNTMEKAINNKAFNELCETLLELRTKDECKKFLRDLCTLEEIRSMSERWQVAKQVDQGIPYRTIAQKTGSSTATITRVAQWLHHGEGGYRLMLHRLSAN